jgi:membrane fusion protein, multidrug efflux system
MTKRIFIAIIGAIAIIGVLAGIKFLQIGRMTSQAAQFAPPPVTVTTADVRTELWESLLTSVGSLTAVQGITVTAERPGKVVHIVFEPGTKVQQGDLLVRQNTSSEEAQLRAEEATVVLERKNLNRLSKLLDEKTIAKSQYDDTLAKFKQAIARADNIRAEIAKKTIRAPFAGRLGIRLIDLGQFLNEGDPIVSLQSMDPIFVDFSLPQQELNQITTGLTVRVTINALPDHVIKGEITAINPQVDAATRNIQIQATVKNPEERLRPGMFVTVAVVLPAQNEFHTIPATSVLYAPYSDSVFVVEDKKDEKSGHTGKVVRQQFVRLGEKRGDYVAILSGLKEKETVVSTGVFKLRNGQSVVVDNTLAPEFKLSPKPKDD